MTIQTIIKYPDPRLQQRAEPVDTFDAALRTLAEDLLETMRDAEGLGITASHIGVAKRVAVVQLTPEDAVKIYVNPEIVWASEQTSEYKEGSVSMQGVVDDISRPSSIRVQYQDLDGNPQTEEAEGLAAVCIQHEIDQMDGLFWLQKLSRLRKDRVIKRYEKINAGPRDLTPKRKLRYTRAP